jgi:hypothetical protein
LLTGISNNRQAIARQSNVAGNCVQAQRIGRRCCHRQPSKHPIGKLKMNKVMKLSRVATLSSVSLALLLVVGIL